MSDYVAPHDAAISASNIVHTIDKLTNKKGQKIWTQSYRQADVKPKALVLFVHGLGEHSSRYRHLFLALADAGCFVFAPDLRGHGHSEGVRAQIDSMDDLVDDAERASEAMDAAARECGADGEAPRFMIGQSLGGLTATCLGLRNQGKWAGGGVILTSAAIDIEWTLITKIQAPLGGVLSCLLPNAALVPAVDPMEMSKLKASCMEYQNDPLNYIGKTRARLAWEVLQRQRIVRARAGEIKFPLLAIHGTTDKCTSASAAKALVEGAASADKKFLPMEGLFHTMLHEPEYQTVVDAIVQFIDRRVGASAKL